ncbi:hypothetical protein [Bacillus bingmayongensis]|uniref:hypothetical protein n=1 Tax=Bacillus bingmayongensis TaxID=1150157 RepID=UPI0002F29935|nr:hypothetical protein [Bacillus bingmayongensis]MBY0594993.1 hypothetical protein [Bacillus bingmayongensis]
MNFVVWSIIGAEVGFWLFIILGLVSRYLFNQKKLGMFLLALVPVIDLILLSVTAVDLYNGGTATQAHALAAVYLGVSLVFGKSMMHWADKKFLYHIKKEGAKPERKIGYEYACHSLKGSCKHLLAYAIGVGILFGLMYLANDPEQVAPFYSTLIIWTVVLISDFIFTISYFIWPRKK